MTNLTTAVARRAALGIPVWVLYFVAQAFLIFFGFILIPLALWCQAYELRESQKYAGRKVMAFTWSAMWIYSNEEDGIDGSANLFWPAIYASGWDWCSVVIRWSCWRNSVGNARWTRLLGCSRPGGIDLYPKDASGGILKEGPYAARMGARVEIKFCWNPSQPDWRQRRYCWIGWRLAQAPIGETGIGFACQFREALT